MIKISRKDYESILSKILNAKDMREITGLMIKSYRFGVVISDLSQGENSPNYHLLKKFAAARKINEKFLIDQSISAISIIKPVSEDMDYHKILESSPDFTAEELRHNWIKLMKKYHPDKIGESGLEKTKKINEAYNTLSNVIKRKKYDNSYPPTTYLRVIDPAENQFTNKGFILVVTFIILVIGFGYFHNTKKFSEIHESSYTEKAYESKAEVTVFNDKNIGTEDDLINESSSIVGNPAINTDETTGTPENNSVKSLSAEIQPKQVLPKLKNEAFQEYDSEPVTAEKSVEIINDSDLKSYHFTGKHNILMNDMNEGANNQVEETKVSLSNDEVTKLSTDHKILKPDTIKSNGKTGSKKSKSKQDTVVQTSSINSTMYKVSKHQNEPKNRNGAGIIQVADMNKQESKPDKTSVYLVISDYITAYKDRDIVKLQGLFSSNAKENGKAIQDVLNNYRDNFERLKILAYDIKFDRVNLKNNRADVYGDFEITFKTNSDNTNQKSSGNIYWNLFRDRDSWLIDEIKYEVSGVNENNAF